MMVFKSVITIILCYCLSQELVNATKKCQTVPTAGGTPTPGEFFILVFNSCNPDKKKLYFT